jgi:hypothetical protein
MRRAKHFIQSDDERGGVMIWNGNVQKILHFGLITIREHELKKFLWDGPGDSPQHLRLSRIGSLFLSEVPEPQSFVWVSSVVWFPELPTLDPEPIPFPTPCRFLRFAPSVGLGENRLVARVGPAQSSA